MLRVHADRVDCLRLRLRSGSPRSLKTSLELGGGCLRQLKASGGHSGIALVPGGDGGFPKLGGQPRLSSLRNGS